VAQRGEAWKVLAENTHDADLFIAPSRYFANRMAERLRLSPDRIRVVPLGINLAGYDLESPRSPRPSGPSPSIGFFARMCREKGLDTLVEAFILLKKRGTIPHLRLKIGGSCGPSDQAFVAELRRRLGASGCLGDVEFYLNLDRAAKIAFLKSLTVFSVPALYGEAFGLYLAEAMAAGVPVVQPRIAAFPEMIEASGAGELCEPGDPGSLANGLERVLRDPARRGELAAAARQAAAQLYSARRMAEETLQALAHVLEGGRPSRPPVSA
jgi:glycosyltransferase involved in cell wall biosynthesis